MNYSPNTSHRSTDNPSHSILTEPITLCIDKSINQSINQLKTNSEISSIDIPAGVKAKNIKHPEHKKKKKDHL